MTRSGRGAAPDGPAQVPAGGWPEAKVVAVAGAADPTAAKH
ncbi:MAG TPA: hypothetical protein VFH66_04085 [Mycobacteriales bacterium]|nr:hypothetical protein [Mycobacteriales bacterium]